MKVLELNPSGYVSSVIHRPDRDWPESNCYVDVVLELLHALGLEPRACLAFTLASGFEDDQWTFYKPQHADLFRLYGVAIEELTVWRALTDHLTRHVASGRIPLVEVDAFFLPDTAQTDYGRKHTKTTVAVNAIDHSARELEYFHNTGYHRLSGADYDGLFRLDRPTPADYLPPYCEIAKIERLVQRPDETLRELAWEQLRNYLARVPDPNPLQRYAEVINDQLGWLTGEDEATYHGYIFATLRQCGSCYEYASLFLDWLGDDRDEPLQRAAECFATVSRTAKMLVMKTARMAATGRVKDISPQVADMALAWEEGCQRLADRARS